MTISSSPHRNSFLQDCYVEHTMKAGNQPDPEIIDYYIEIKRRSNEKFDEPATRINNLEYDLRTADWILEKVRVSDVYAQNLYAAICNNDFVKSEIIPILKEEKWSCSWRYAGGIIADMRQVGDYVDWYCPGSDVFSNVNGTVREGSVTDEIRSDLKRLGWFILSN